MPYPLAQAAYNAYVQTHGRTDKAMREFIESHGVTIEHDSHLLKGESLRPYWDTIEAKLAGEDAQRGVGDV